MTWSFFSSFALTITFCKIRYGTCYTYRRWFWNGLNLGIFQASLGGTLMYFMSPWCQELNRAELQSISREQRFKNYIDKKYNFYENADSMMYDIFKGYDGK